MAVKTWTLIDVDRNIYEEELQLDGDVRVAKRRLRGGLSDGVDLVEIDNGNFSFGVVPTRGMNLWRAKMRDTKNSQEWDRPKILEPMCSNFSRLDTIVKPRITPRNGSK